MKFLHPCPALSFRMLQKCVEKERGVWNLDKSVTPHDGLDVSQPKERSSGIIDACSGTGRQIILYF